MPNHPLCNKLNDALYHATNAYELTAAALDLPSSHLLEAQHRRLLGTTRNNLRRAKHVLIALVLRSTKAVYTQTTLPYWDEANADRELQEATSPSPQNVQPAGPE